MRNLKKFNNHNGRPLPTKEGLHKFLKDAKDALTGGQPGWIAELEAAQKILTQGDEIILASKATGFEIDIINITKNQLMECKRFTWSNFQKAVKGLGEKFSQPSRLSNALRMQYQSPPGGTGNGLIGYIEINDATNSLTRTQVINKIKQYLNNSNVPQATKNGINRMDKIRIMRSNNNDPMSEFSPILKSEWQ